MLLGSLYVDGVKTSLPYNMDYKNPYSVEIKDGNNEIEWVKWKDTEYYATKHPILLSTSTSNSITFNKLDSLGLINFKIITIGGKKYSIGLLNKTDVIDLKESQYSNTRKTFYLYNNVPSSGKISWGIRDIYADGSSWTSWTTSYTPVGESPKLKEGYDYIPQYMQNVGFRLFLKEINEVPTISGTDTNIGDKNNAFNIEYSVNDTDTTNTLTVTERLNSTVLRTISNATRNEPYIITITDEQIKALELNSSNRVQIEVNDGQGGIAYRNYTFTKSNSAPIVTGQDEDLGGLVNPFSKTYQVHDQEGDTITVTEKLNGTVLRQFEATQNTDYTVTINEELWQTLGNETHVLTVEATDSIGSTTVRTFTFRRLVNSILLELKTPSETDAKASKIMVVPVWRGINNADVVVSACNNAFDTVPTWENITDAVLNNIPYMFTNEAKTDAKWGVNIKFEITRKEGTTEQIILDGFGGAFE